jgi:TIR domain-containing protein
MPRSFISFRRDDSGDIANTIKQAMEQRFGIGSVVFDVDTIPFGVDFRAATANAVKECDLLLAIVGDGWMGGSSQRRLDNPADPVRIEIESALEHGIPVILALVGDATIPSHADVPESIRALRDCNAVEVRAGRDLQQHVHRLVRAVESTYEQQCKKQKRLQRDIIASTSHLAPLE